MRQGAFICGLAVPICEFCNMRSSLLCDGKLPNGKTCDRRVCRNCAKQVMHVRTSKGCDTRDLCPACVKEGRTA